MNHRFGVCALTAAALCTGLVVLPTTSMGRPPCQPVSCSGVDPLPCGSFSPGITPDRRPVWVINCFGGNWEGGAIPSGIRPEWRDSDDDGLVSGVGSPDPAWDTNGIADAFDWLMWQMDRGYDLGYRRIMIFLPAGSLDDQAMSSSQWWTMPSWKRDGFENEIADWIDINTGVSVGVYAGYQLKDPCDLDMTSAGDPVCDDSSPGGTDEVDACTIHNNVQPWIDIGVSEYWFDAAELDKDGMLSIRNAAEYAGIHMGGEAVPIDRDGLAEEAVVDLYWVERSPWVARRYFYLRIADPFAMEAYDELSTTPLDPMDTEVGMSYIDVNDLPASTSISLSIVEDDKAKGLVPWVWDFERAHESVARAYWPTHWAVATPLANLGVACPADFNYDGSVGSADQAILLSNWNASGMTLSQGDMTGDGSVTSADLAIFLGYSWGTCP